MVKSRYNLENIYSYIVGNIRYFFFYSRILLGIDLSFLIRKHIIEQIVFRIKVMDKDCFNQGSCKLCGCKTTALQMANKACDKPCYPKMMNKKQWYQYKTKHRL